MHHRQSAHCESGVVSSLLTHHGLAISEPMAFGLASALMFAYIPIIKLAGMPLIAYRMPPGAIVKAMHKRLGVPVERETFRDPARGMAALDAALAAGRVVGLQTCVYWLPYFPEPMRFHFNAHNLIVYGKEGDEYLISDPVFETAVRCPSDALRKARFAKGALAAKGLMYYPTRTPAAIDLERLIPNAIRANYRSMMQAPIPLVGVRGIRFLARKLTKMQRAQDAQLPLVLAHIVRMQEEIGTGGAGFRFLYGSFLQQAAHVLNKDVLRKAAQKMTEAGDEWRRFALHATKMCRNRAPMDANALASILNGCADRESAAWEMLRSV